MSDLPIACTLTDGQLQQRRAEIMHQLAGHVQETQPLASGYALRFADDDAVLTNVLHIIKLERECCPFLQFQLTFAANHGPVWLHITGPEGTKAMLEAEFGLG